MLYYSLPADAVRIDEVTKSASDNDIEVTMKEWLRGSADRSGVRRRRREHTLSVHSAINGDKCQHVNHADSNCEASD